MEDKTVCVLVAASAICILGSIYLLMGHNSVGFTTMIAILAALGGYVIPSPIGGKK